MMNNKLQIKNLVGAFALCLCFAVAGFAQSVPMVGGFKAMPANSNEALQAAEFAVETQSAKQEIAIEFSRVLTAARQTVGGTNYRLCIEADVFNEDDEAETKQFLVTVFRSLRNEFSLKSWSERTCAK